MQIVQWRLQRVSLHNPSTIVAILILYCIVMKWMWRIGKLTALWPFIGIVIEVAILVAIIIYFEKKKAKELAQKRAAQEEDEQL